MIPCMNNINIWGQNLEGYFKDAIATKTISDWMIAVAPSVSYEYVLLYFQIDEHFNIKFIYSYIDYGQKCVMYMPVN